MIDDVKNHCEYESKLIEVMPYRNTGIQVVFACVLFIPASLFMIYAPFRDPCSPDRTSGDCSLGSSFMESFYIFFMISIGVASILACFYLIWKYYKDLKTRKGSRVAFTEDSIIGPIWGFWSSPEGEIKFSEIIELSIARTNVSVLITVATLDRKMLLQKNFLMNEDSFRRIYNHLAHKLEKPTFEEAASKEVLETFKPLKLQLDEINHLFYAFVYFLAGAGLSLLFGSYSESQQNSDVWMIGLIISLSGFGFIFNKFHRKIWESDAGPILIFIFLMLFGLFLGFIGTVGLLSI